MELTQSKLVETTLKKKTSSSSYKLGIARKSTIDHEEQQFCLLDDSLKIMNTLNEMRFIEKISRPIERRTKEEYVEKFAGWMENLHNKLHQIKSDLTNKFTNQKINNKQKSVVGSLTNEAIDWKKSIRAIENRYIEIFYEGSFKFYRKLHKLNKFSYSLQPIGIEEWSSFCLSGQVGEKCC